MDFSSFLLKKAQEGCDTGFAPKGVCEHLFDFQTALVDWACRKGRAAIFADTGLGKTLIELEWARQVVEHSGRPVLILTPLAVAAQTVREADKFGIDALRAPSGIACRSINVANYERLHFFDPADFSGVVCDESSILKSFDGARRSAITEFMRKVHYRLLATATAAPNDYIELGTSSEALGYLGHVDMLNRFFRNDQNNSANRGMYGERVTWRFKGHAEQPFWRWVCSWARAVRQPSDLGFDDSRFILPPLTETQHIIDSAIPREGMLFVLPAEGLQEQREERRLSLDARCEALSNLVTHDQPAAVWCHLNPEGDLLAKVIPGAVQVSGADSDESKEEKFLAFASGEARVLVTKPKIGAWGLNFQHCAHVGCFPSHSYEQYYQLVRRCYRFGQKRPVRVDIVSTEGESKVLDNMQRKSRQAERMFANLVEEMNHSLALSQRADFGTKTELPQWLS
jgi:hypothetical protein